MSSIAGRGSSACAEIAGRDVLVVRLFWLAGRVRVSERRRGRRRHGASGGSSGRSERIVEWSLHGVELGLAAIGARSCGCSRLGIGSRTEFVHSIREQRPSGVVAVRQDVVARVDGREGGAGRRGGSLRHAETKTADSAKAGSDLVRRRPSVAARRWRRRLLMHDRLSGVHSKCRRNDVICCCRHFSSFFKKLPPVCKSCC